MRISRRRLGGALTGLLLVVLLVPASVAGLRWRAAGEAHAITSPGGAVVQPTDERVVMDRAAIIALGLRTDRGEATVRIYAIPPDLPWLQARKIVATQLDHWNQLGTCTDDAGAQIVECAWREPTRWWPRDVRLTLIRPPASDGGRTFLIIGSGRGK